MTDKEFKNTAPNLFQLKKLGCGFSVPEEYFEISETTIVFEALHSNKEQGFTTPENYFDSIEDKVLNKILKNDAEFSIPKDYFDSVEDNVFVKIHNQPKVINLKSRVLKQFLPVSVAASLLLFISLQFFNNNNTTNTDLFANLEVSEIENWIENEELNLDSFDIASIYEDDDIEILDINTLYEDNEMLNYLNDIDIESLIITN